MLWRRFRRRNPANLGSKLRIRGAVEIIARPSFGEPQPGPLGHQETVSPVSGFLIMGVQIRGPGSSGASARRAVGDYDRRRYFATPTRPSRPNPARATEVGSGIRFPSTDTDTLSRNRICVLPVSALVVAVSCSVTPPLTFGPAMAVVWKSWYWSVRARGALPKRISEADVPPPSISEKNSANETLPACPRLLRRTKWKPCRQG